MAHKKAGERNAKKWRTTAISRTPAFYRVANSHPFWGCVSFFGVLSGQKKKPVAFVMTCGLQPCSKQMKADDNALAHGACPSSSASIYFQAAFTQLPDSMREPHQRRMRRSAPEDHHRFH
eukprot:gene18733-6139_t